MSLLLSVGFHYSRIYNLKPISLSIVFSIFVGGILYYLLYLTDRYYIYEVQYMDEVHLGYIIVGILNGIFINLVRFIQSKF